MNEDLALNSLENAYRTVEKNRACGGADDFEAAEKYLSERMRRMYGFYRRWYRPLPYADINPLTQHLYSEMTLSDLTMAFPEPDRPGSDPSPEDYLSVIDRCVKSGDIYCLVVARRFLGHVYSGQQQMDKALEQYLLALEVARAARLDNEIGHLLRHSGYVLSVIGRHDEAILQLRKAFTREQNPIFNYWSALTLRELGDAYFRKAVDSSPEQRIPS